MKVLPALTALFLSSTALAGWGDATGGGSSSGSGLGGSSVFVKSQQFFKDFSLVTTNGSSIAIPRNSSEYQPGDSWQIPGVVLGGDEKFCVPMEQMETDVLMEYVPLSLATNEVAIRLMGTQPPRTLTADEKKKLGQLPDCEASAKHLMVIRSLLLETGNSSEMVAKEMRFFNSGSSSSMAIGLNFGNNRIVSLNTTGLPSFRDVMRLAEQGTKVTVPSSVVGQPVNLVVRGNGSPQYHNGTHERTSSCTVRSYRQVCVEDYYSHHEHCYNETIWTPGTKVDTVTSNSTTYPIALELNSTTGVALGRIEFELYTGSSDSVHEGRCVAN
jgi:hypothetical protein